MCARCLSQASITLTSRRLGCSLNDDVEELVPVGRLEPGEHHGETLNLLDDATLDVECLSPALVWIWDQVYLQEALLHQIVEIVVIAELLAAELVLLLQALKLLARLRNRVKHVRVEEVANLFVIVLQGLEDQQGRYYEEDLGVSLLEELSKLFMFLRSSLDYLRKVQKLVTFLRIQEIR